MHGTFPDHAVGSFYRTERYGIGRIPSSVVCRCFRTWYAVVLSHVFCTTWMLVAARVVYRHIYELLFFTKRKSRHVLIFGASRPGLVAYAMLQDDIRSKNKVVAFVEDNGNRVGKNS